MNVVDLLKASPLLRQPPLAIAIDLVVFLGFIVVAAAIIIDFKRYYRQPRRVVGADRSVVETGTMAAFFAVYYLVIRLRWLEVEFGGTLRSVALAVGLALVVAGVAFNVYGRVTLKAGWANQIKVYEGQELSTRGPFAVVRHPLYASLIWIFVGGSLIYANVLSLALTLCVFVPMMWVRARKEDAVLLGSFGEEYKEYKNRTGMFLPRVRGRAWRT